MSWSIKDQRDIAIFQSFRDLIMGVDAFILELTHCHQIYTSILDNCQWEAARGRIYIITDLEQHAAYDHSLPHTRWPKNFKSPVARALKRRSAKTFSTNEIFGNTYVMFIQIWYESWGRFLLREQISRRVFASCVMSKGLLGLAAGRNVG